MSPWGHLCCVGYGLHARCDALWHLARGHKVHWREHVDLWTGHTGSIWCEGCADTNDGKGGNDLIFWTRHWTLLMRIGQLVCGLLGHRESRESTRWNGEGEPGDEAQMVGTGEWYCYRCVADVPPPL